MYVYVCEQSSKPESEVHMLSYPFVISANATNSCTGDVRYMAARLFTPGHRLLRSLKRTIVRDVTGCCGITDSLHWN